MILKIITPTVKYITHNLGSILFYGTLAYITVTPNDFGTMKLRGDQVLGFVASVGSVVGNVLHDLFRGGA